MSQNDTEIKDCAKSICNESSEIRWPPRVTCEILATAFYFQSPLKIGQMMKKSPAGLRSEKLPPSDGIVLSPKDAKGTTMVGPETPPPPPLQCKIFRPSATKWGQLFGVSASSSWRGGDTQLTRRRVSCVGGWHITLSRDGRGCSAFTLSRHMLVQERKKKTRKLYSMVCRLGAPTVMEQQGEVHGSGMLRSIVCLL